MTQRVNLGAAPAALPVRSLSDPTPAEAADLALAAMRATCEEVTRACAELAARGCLVLGAHAVPGRPRVVVIAPPERAGLRAGRLRWNRMEATYATRLGEVQVEWCVRRRPGIDINLAWGDAR